MASTEVPKAKLFDNLSIVINEVEELLTSIAFEAGDKAEVLRGKAQESLRIAKEQLQDLEDVMIEKSKFAVRATDDYVHAHPWSAVGVAAGLGVVIGLMLNRR